MALRARTLLLPLALFTIALGAAAADARFDLVGPKIDVRVTRADANGLAHTLPIASVPNLQPGDKLWLHPDLPPTQSVKYLLICVFLRGTTNPPPQDWFIRIETWSKRVREEGAYVTVPPEAQQALLFMAPETGGDFSTLRSAIQGRPGAFVRAQQDLTEAGFEQARIEKYVASIRRVPPADPTELQKHSDFLARTLALKPNADCFKRPIDTQFTCLTQTGSQVLLDDGHGLTVVAALSTGPGSDFIQQASYTKAFGAGVYSAYVGAIVDLARIMGNLHTAQYQYIPAISFPQGESMNLRLNTPPSFHNPKSVLVIALPSVQPAIPPPLRPADANHIACLLQPSVALPIEGAPLVFSADFAHDLVLHLNTPPGAPTEPDIPLLPDAYAGGLVLQTTPQHHTQLKDPLKDPLKAPLTALTHPDLAPKITTPSVEEPVLLTGTVQGRWGFDAYTGPTVQLQQLPGADWHIVQPTGEAADPSAGLISAGLIAGQAAELLIASTGTACVHNVTATPTAPSAKSHAAEITLPYKQQPGTDRANLLAVTLPVRHDLTPGNLHLAIQQYGQPESDEISTRTFSEPAHIAAVEVRAGDRTILLRGTLLDQIDHVSLGDLIFSPLPNIEAESGTATNTLHLSLPSGVAAPPTKIDDRLTARIALHDGRTLTLPVKVSGARPLLTLLRKTIETPAPASIALTNPDDLPLTSHLTFTLKSPTAFPRSGQIEIETLDGTLRTVLTLSPSGGLVLQDPHTLVATLDPLRSFGQSAFGALHLRAVFPLPHPDKLGTDPAPSTPVTQTAEPQTSSIQAPGIPSSGIQTAPASDWIPLVTLVRLPTLTQLQCPPDPAQPCTLVGTNLFLLQAISADPAFADPMEIPDGYTGNTLLVPHAAASTIFLRLRDDPTAINSAILPTPPLPAHTHTTSRPASAIPAPSTPAPATPAPDKPTTVPSPNQP